MFGLIAELLRSIDFTPEGRPIPTPPVLLPDGTKDPIQPNKFKKPRGMGPEKPLPVDPINPGYNNLLNQQVQRTPGGDMPPSAYTHPTGPSGGNPVPPPAPYKIQDAIQEYNAGGPGNVEYPWRKFPPGQNIKPPPGDEAVLSNRTYQMSHGDTPGAGDWGAKVRKFHEENPRAVGPNVVAQQEMEHTAHVAGYRWTVFTSQGMKFAKTPEQALEIADKYGAGRSSISVIRPGWPIPGSPMTPGMPIMSSVDGGKAGQVNVGGFMGARGFGPNSLRNIEFKPPEEVMAARKQSLDSLHRNVLNDRMAGPATQMVGKAMNALMAAQMAEKVAETASSARERQLWHQTVEAVRAQRLQEGRDPQTAERDAIYEADRQRSSARMEQLPPMPAPRNDSYGDAQGEPEEIIDSTGRPKIIYRKKTYGYRK